MTTGYKLQRKWSVSNMTPGYMLRKKIKHFGYDNRL